MGKYSSELNMEKENTTYRIILGQIEPGANVLEFGPAGGALTQYLRDELHCHVYIVEIDEDSFREAVVYAEEGICGDIEDFEWETRFADVSFDYILFADVLEHLRVPEQVLKRAGKLLKDSGKVMVSLPNIAHNDILLNLYDNMFCYTETGLLDDTHIRFFAYRNLDDFFAKAELAIVKEDYTQVQTFHSEQKIENQNFGGFVEESFFARPCGEIFQFVLTAQKRQYVERQGVLPERPIQAMLDASPARESANYYMEVQNLRQNLANKEGHIELLLQSERDLKAALEQAEQAHLEQMAMQECRRTEWMADQERNHAEQMAAQERRRTEWMADQERNHAEQMAAQERRRIEWMADQERNHAEQMAVQEREHTAQMIAYERECSERMAAQEQSHAARMAAQEQAYATRMVAREQEYAEQMVACKQECAEQIAICKQECTEQLVACKQEYAEQIAICKQQCVEQMAVQMQEHGAVVASLQQTLHNKEGHIALLLDSDRELERIKNSRSWRFMGYAWRLRDVLVPQGSKRRLLCKMCIKFVKNPIRFLKKCSPSRIRKFFKTLKREGVEGTSRRLDDALIGNQIIAAPVKIEVLSDVSEKTAADYLSLYVPQWENPTVSIVIPVYNQFDYTYLCVKSILENSGDVSYEILIADDCSTDLTTQIDDVIHGLHTIHNKENLRFLRNCNHAAKQARGKYILFLNNDTQVQENWLAPLVELIERDETIGMVGSKLIYPDGRLQEAGGILWKDGSAWNFGNRSDPDMPEFNYVKEVDYISGAAIMIRKTLWEEIGGFDERFVPAYCEDSDLAFEVRKHGYKVMYQPKSVVVHFEGVSNGTDTSSGQKAYQVINQQKFYEKWKDVLEREHNPNAENPFLARERGIGKKVLLMVDHYVPQFDKDAGSRTVYQYLQLFVDQGYHVKFIGDNFYPHQPYTEVLQQMGIEVLYGPYYAQHWKQWLKENGSSIQYAFLNRPHIAVNYIDEIRRYTPAKIVYYGHDLHFLREQREYELTGDESLVRSAQDWQKKELALMRKADMAYYPSYVEEEEIHRIAPDVHVKAIPAYLFREVEECRFMPENRKNIMFIGGFGHKPNVDAVKWLAQEIMPLLEKRLPNIVVHILGSNPPDEVKALATEHLRIEGFVTDEELAQYYRTCRMAIVPLRYGAGIKGKVVEAMRYGMPVVTTSVGAEGLANVGKILAIADSSRDFADRIATLYNDKESLQLRSKKSVQYIRENFSPSNAKTVIGSEFDME